MYGSGTRPLILASCTTLIVSNEEMNDFMKIFKSLKESGLLIKDCSKGTKYEENNKKEGFLSMLLGTLGAIYLGNVLTDKGTIKTGEGFLIRPHPLTNFKIQKYYQDEPKFNGFYTRNNLPKTKDDAYVINLEKYKSVETHWIALCVNSNNNVTYFESFQIIENKYIISHIYRTQAYDSIMSGRFCGGFIDFMLKGKSLLDYKNLFSSNDYGKNDKIILKYFRSLKRCKKYCVICSKYRKFGKPKISFVFEKTSPFSINCSKCKNEDEKILKKKNQLKY